MKSFAELREALMVEATKGKYKGHSWKLSKFGSSYSLYVDDEKIDVYTSVKAGEKAAKEFIDLSN